MNKKKHVDTTNESIHLRLLYSLSVSVSNSDNLNTFYFSSFIFRCTVGKRVNSIGDSNDGVEYCRGINKI